MVTLFSVLAVVALIYVLFEYRAERKKATEQISDLRERISGLRERLDRAGAFRTVTESNFKIIQAALDKNRAENLDNQKLLDKWAEELAANRKEIGAAKNECADVATKNLALREKLNGTEALLSRAIADHVSLNNYAGALERRLKSLTAAKKRAAARGRSGR